MRRDNVRKSKTRLKLASEMCGSARMRNRERDRSRHVEIDTETGGEMER